MRHNLEQGSKEWHEFRQKHIGASDAPIIMGVSPWSTPFKLYQEKLGQVAPKEETDSMRRGKDLEETVRNLFNEETGMMMHPTVFTHPDHEWMSASLDGINPFGTSILEIKCPGKHDHEEALKKAIPEKYFPQLQHQLAVTGASSAYYCSYNPTHEKPLVYFEIKADPLYIEMLIGRCYDFWECLTTFTPPSLTESDYVLIETEEWQKAVKKYNDFCLKADTADKEREEAKKKLVELANGRNVKGCGVTAMRICRKGSINYEAIPELRAVDLETYRKPSSEYWKVVMDKYGC